MKGQVVRMFQRPLTAAVMWTNALGKVGVDMLGKERRNYSGSNFCIRLHHPEAK